MADRIRWRNDGALRSKLRKNQGTPPDFKKATNAIEPAGIQWFNLRPNRCVESRSNPKKRTDPATQF